MLFGCAAQSQDETSSKEESSGIADEDTADTFGGAFDAITTPLEDIGIKRKPIPGALKETAKAPYAKISSSLCANIRREIAELDKLLGPDVDVPKTEKTLDQQGANFMESQAYGMIRSHTSIVPFRGVVRHITGAAQHAEDIEQAYQAGKLRRAFLKGMGTAYGKNCLHSKTVLAKNTKPVKEPETPKPQP